MKRLLALIMSLALVFAVSIPASFAQDEAAQCREDCKAQAETCKENCADDESCQEDCVAQQEDCQSSCN